MNIVINNRGNGVCPECSHFNDCALHHLLTKTMVDRRDPSDSGMEIVIYTCPYFER